MKALLLFALAGLLAPWHAQAQTSAADKLPLVAVDNTGHTIGRIIGGAIFDTRNVGLVTIAVKGSPIPGAVETNDALLLPFGNGSLWFTSGDCTGSAYAYMGGTYSGTRPSVVLAIGSTTYWYLPRAEGPAVQTIASRYQNGQCEPQAPFSAAMQILRAPIDLLALYPTPWTVK